MKKLLITLLIVFTAKFAFADSVLIEGFEYGNHDGETPVGWICNDNSWAAGYLEKDLNRKPHTGNWYAYTTTDDSWMFMELFMSNRLKYRYYFWTISDGEYDVEIWAGNAPSADQMTHLLLSTTINNSEYSRFSEYIESIPSDFQYFGIHATAHSGANCLTLDDVVVDVVAKYDLDVSPDRMDTVMMPGDRVAFHYKVKNTGYEDLHIFMNGYTDHFIDIDFYQNGQHGNSFPAAANQSVDAVCYATLRPDVEIGSLCWLDIMFTVSCDCVTRMATLWATAGTESVAENGVKTGVYPNPSNGAVTIEGDGVLTITNVFGQEILKKEIFEKETVTLEKGIYFVTIDNGLSEKLIVR